jgi:Rps23 Pro-64 3,4-dihydroxylase Tpa1-like proline 4-hydroxylase
MKVQYYNKDFPYIVIDDFYSENELTLIWEELNFLCYYEKLQPPQNTGSAFIEGAKLLKQNYGLFLDDIFPNRVISNILTCNRKIFKDLNIIKNHPNWFFKNFQYNQDYTILSYYENDHEYKQHHDVSNITCLSWFNKSPKQFLGGDLIFENGKKIEYKDNRYVIFPSIIKHQVSKVSMDSDCVGKKMGRFCITQFLCIT